MLPKVLIDLITEFCVYFEYDHTIKIINHDIKTRMRILMRCEMGSLLNRRNVFRNILVTAMKDKQYKHLVTREVQNIAEYFNNKVSFS